MVSKIPAYIFFKKLTFQEDPRDASQVFPTSVMPQAMELLEVDRGALSGQLEMWGSILVGGEETRFLQEEGVDQD